MSSEQWAMSDQQWAMSSLFSWFIVSSFSHCHFEATNNSGDLHCQFTDMPELFFADVSRIESNIELRSELSAGSLCNNDELMKFRTAPSFKSFGEVWHYRYWRSLYLLPKAEIPWKLLSAGSGDTYVSSTPSLFATRQDLQISLYSSLIAHCSLLIHGGQGFNFSITRLFAGDSFPSRGSCW